MGLLPGGEKAPKSIPDRVIRIAEPQAERFVDNCVTNSKYTVVNFLPRALFEQFRRLANVYFLLMGGLMLLGTYSSIFETPLGAFTTLFPLAIVLTISMIQEGLADIKRHRSDDETNNRVANITSYIQGSRATSETVRWRDIRVGDVIKVVNKQPLPADVVVVASSEDENIAYIETSSIDGETNLKLRRAITYMPTDYAMQPDDVLTKMEAEKGSIICEPPNMKINSFTGTYNTVNNLVVPIDNDNVVLRGSQLRNTKWILGVVVYTGEDTKLQRNSRHAPSKMSRIDMLVNRAIYLIFLADVILCTISTILLLDFEKTTLAGLTYAGYYLPGVTPADTIASMPTGIVWDTERTTFIEGWLTFIVLYNNFIPISMYVTLEVMTYVHMFYINEDLELYHEESDTPAKARSNIVTDLGQIEYVFSDKTGTLTQNVMRFKRCSVNTRIYGAPILITDANANVPYVNISQISADSKPGSKMDDFLKILSICHTVVVERIGTAEAPPERRPSGSERRASGAERRASNPQHVAITVAPAAGSPALKFEYQAESPDEKALVEAARDFGYELVGRTTSAITVAINGVAQVWTPLAVNKFDSDRKRMSIVVRDHKGSIRLLCKGADTAMLKFGRCETNEEFVTVDEHLKLFAQEGLRTLVLGYKELTEKQFDEWMTKYKTASASAKDRAEMMSAVASEIEHDMKIVGITAIEDKLQDGVPETIADLAAAGIKVCVLTGDKMETAINIGYSCKVLREHMTLLKLEYGSPEEVEKGLCTLYRSVKERQGEPLYQQSWNMFSKKKAQVQQGIRTLLHKHIPDIDESGAGTNKMTPVRSKDSDMTHNLTPHEGEQPPAPQQRTVQVKFTRGASVRSTHLKAPREPMSNYAFIMEGPALVSVLGQPALESLLFQVLNSCTAVIACRVSPKQKAQLVNLVKSNVTPVPVTLAIGDGANDVGMIQEAHVGIGVSGNEGQQAVNASDYAIAQFRFLKRLLLVHGRWNYRRHSKVVLYSFYKNIALIMTLFFYLFSCGFSGTSVYEDNVLAGYNFFLGLPIFALGLFDKDVEASFVMSHPWMYVSGRRNLDLNVLQVMKWISAALLHGFFVYYFVLWSVMPGPTHDETSFAAFGLGLYAVLIVTMDLKCMLEFRSILRPAFRPETERQLKGKESRLACAFCGWTLWIWVGSVMFFFISVAIYGNMIGFSPAFYGVANVSFNLSNVWLQIVLIPVICVAIDELYYFFVDEFVPSPVTMGIEQNRCMAQPKNGVGRPSEQLKLPA